MRFDENDNNRNYNTVQLISWSCITIAGTRPSKYYLLKFVYTFIEYLRAQTTFMHLRPCLTDIDTHGHDTSYNKYCVKYKEKNRVFTSHWHWISCIYLCSCWSQRTSWCSRGLHTNWRCPPRSQRKVPGLECQTSPRWKLSQTLKYNTIGTSRLKIYLKSCCCFAFKIILCKVRFCRCH